MSVAHHDGQNHDVGSRKDLRNREEVKKLGLREPFLLVD